MTDSVDREVAFLSEGPDTSDEHDSIQWIGFRGISVTGESKEFWWWRNCPGPLNILKVFCGALLAQRLIEAQIGPAIDLSGSLSTKPNSQHCPRGRGW